jgi:hypothetical protein
MPARPDSACLLCPPPSSDLPWRLADPGYRTCARCLDQLRTTLRDLVARYLRLSTRPETSTGGRGRPGFASRAPASEHIIAMRDRRSKPCAWSRDAPAYVFDPHADHVLQPGQLGPPRGEYVQKLDVWYGRDGRPHTEADRPPRSPLHVLNALAAAVAEYRGITPPTSSRPCPVAGRPHTHIQWVSGRAIQAPPPDPEIVRIWRWLDNQLDWITRQDWVDEAARDIRELEAQLRPVTGDPGGRRIGECPNTIDEGATTRPCRTPLYAPLRGDTIVCANPACARRWPRPEWVRLGQLLQSATLAS